MEIESNDGGDYSWAWVSMDAYTNDISKIGVPTILRRNHIQCYVDNISVRAGGAAKIATGEWARGNIEFTPSNYAGENAKDVPDATGAFDLGDRLYHPHGDSPRRFWRRGFQPRQVRSGQGDCPRG